MGGDFGFRCSGSLDWEVRGIPILILTAPRVAFVVQLSERTKALAGAEEDAGCGATWPQLLH